MQSSTSKFVLLISINSQITEKKRIELKKVEFNFRNANSRVGVAGVTDEERRFPFDSSTTNGESRFFECQTLRSANKHRANCR